MPKTTPSGKARTEELPSSTVACGSTPGALSTEPLRATTDSLLAPVHGP